MRDNGLNSDLDFDLPSVLGAGAPRATSFNGTKSLLLAVLEDGVRSYLSPVKELRLEAEYWVASARQRSPFSFVVICETLGLEPTAVRVALTRLRAQRGHRSRSLGRTRPNVRRANRVSQRQAG